MKLSSQLLVLGASVTNAQSFLSATGAYPQLSQFRQLLINQPSIAGALLSTTNSAGNRTTVLVPNNAAFDRYHQYTGQYVEGLQSSDLTDLVNYHSLNGALSSSDLQKPTGLVASTSLTDPRYNNLGLGSNGAMQPQVVYVGSNNASPSQSGANSTGLFVQSGLVSNAALNAIDGTWDGGLFHIVDKYVNYLPPSNLVAVPMMCERLHC